MTASSATPEQLAGCLRLMDLADEADSERNLWRNDEHRSELRGICIQLTMAGRLALSATEVWAEAWAEAGRLTIDRYRSQRKTLEHLS